MDSVERPPAQDRALETHDRKALQIGRFLRALCVLIVALQVVEISVEILWKK